MELTVEIKNILDTLHEAGYDAYLVGGALRDSLLNRDGGDFDVTSAASPETVIKLFSHLHVIPTGLKHGTVTVITENSTPVEITTFRTDGEYLDSRRPESVSFAASVEEDLSRRDFTVNALAYNEKRGLVDLFGGREDLEAGIIRCVGDPEKRFSEDALRIMRAFRFASQLDFDIAQETLRGAHNQKEGLKNIARERIGSEMLKLLDGISPSKALIMMGDIIDIVLPVRIDDQRKREVENLKCDAVGRLAFLLCGAAENEISLASHWLRLSSKQASRLKKLSIPIAPERLENPTDAEMRRIFAEYRDDAETAVIIASHLYKIPPDSLEILRRIKAQNPPVCMSDLAVNGGDIMECGAASGRHIGELLEFLLAKVIDDPTLNERQTLINIALEASENW